MDSSTFEIIEATRREFIYKRIYSNRTVMYNWTPEGVTIIDGETTEFRSQLRSDFEFSLFVRLCQDSILQQPELHDSYVMNWSFC